MGTYGQSNLQYPRVPCSPMHDFCPWGVKVTVVPYFCSELVYFQLSSNASYCAFSSFIKVLFGNYLQQCWQLKHFENYYFTLKKKKEVSGIGEFSRERLERKEIEMVTGVGTQ